MLQTGYGQNQKWPENAKNIKLVISKSNILKDRPQNVPPSNMHIEFKKYTCLFWKLCTQKVSKPILKDENY